jgi:NADH-quinone oxidoreductase subunit C
MDKAQLAGFVKSIDSEVETKEGKQYTEVTIPPAKFYQVAKKLRESDETCFDFLSSLSGVDYGKELGTVYHLYSTKHKHWIVLKTKTSDREKPELPTVCDIWRTAELHEREVYDLLGVRFSNHPDLRRLFLDSSWGFPLRKDYTDDINIVTK